MTVLKAENRMALQELQTPCLVLDRARMEANVGRLKNRLAQLGVPLRPHLKTCKSIKIARLLMPTASGPAAVSTLMEAEQFAAAGVRDILYAVGIVPRKLQRVRALRSRDIDVSVVLDSLTQAEAVVSACRAAGEAIPVLIEIDCDGHRAGIRPGDGMLVKIGRVLAEGGAELRGVMTHAGGSYECRGAEALTAAAENERAAAVDCASELRDAGLPCPIVSVGSTPTAHFARDLSGVTEVRAGVFVFFDLVMAGLGVCSLYDIALSVLTTVIGHRSDKHWILVDAGWMAMSRDRGTAQQAVDQGYGVVCDMAGRPYPDLLLKATNQEHGIVSLREGSAAVLPDLPVGSQVRILPNHACATAAQHSCYHIVDSAQEISGIWQRFSGW